MIPRTFPSRLINGRRAMVVRALNSVTGLQQWIDYIPVKVTADPGVNLNSYSGSAYAVPVDEANPGMAWVDYIPVYLTDYPDAKKWTSDNDGWVPLYDVDNNLGWSPLRLFAAGEQGAWYDPSDFDRYMSQLGPELVTNGDFSSGTGWTLASGASISGGKLVLSGVAANTTFADRAVSPSLVAGRSYEVSFTVTDYVAGAIFAFLSGGSNTTSPIVSANGTYRYILTAAGNNSSIGLRSGGVSCTLSIDNYSVRELTAIDTATLFQDAAGTTPVTAVEQPVGLVLDKSKGLVLGSELVTSPSVAVSGAQNADVGAGLIAGRYYKVTATVTNYAGTGDTGFYGASFTGIAGATRLSANGTMVGIVQALSSGNFGVFGRSTNSATYSNISVRELPGNHASQTTAASRPVLKARVNLLTQTEDFSAAVWVKQGTVPIVTSNATTAPDGTLTADQIAFPAAGSGNRIQQVASPGPNGLATVSVWLRGAVGGEQIRIWNGWPTIDTAVTLTTSWQRFSFAEGSFNNSSGLYLYAVTGTPTIFAWGADVRLTTDATALIPAYQRVTTSTDYDTTGFPRYLAFDGVDDSLSTASINFTSTAQMSVFAGVTKLTDATQGVVVALGGVGSDVGSFEINAPYTAGTASYGAFLRNSGLGGWRQTTFTAPTTNVTSHLFDFSLTAGSGVDKLSARINGAPAASTWDTGNAGTGNFGTYAMRMGSRSGTFLSFNGRLYELIVRGAATNASDISNAERFVAQQSGITLP